MGIVNNRRVRTVFPACQKGVFQVSSSLPCDNFGLANEARFVDVLARWLFSTQTSTAHPTLMNVDELWKARAPDYTHDLFVRGHR